MPSEALIWAMKCMTAFQFFDVVSTTDCSYLVKMVSSPEECPAFFTHMKKFRCSETLFPNFRIIHIPKTQNTIIDKFARSAKSFLSAIFYVDFTSSADLVS